METHAQAPTTTNKVLKTLIYLADLDITAPGHGSHLVIDLSLGWALTE
jgi:hypothetical protein